MTKSKTLVELLPCPFCGTGNEWISQLDGISRCAECGCTCKTEYWNTRTHQDTDMQKLRESMQVWIGHHNKRADDAEVEVQHLRGGGDGDLGAGLLHDYA